MNAEKVTNPKNAETVPTFGICSACEERKRLYEMHYVWRCRKCHAEHTEKLRAFIDEQRSQIFDKDSKDTRRG